jgi:hypothetical protein
MRSAVQQKAKLTVRVDSSALDRAKRYAAAHNTSLSKLISEYLRFLDAGPTPARAPILGKLTGILPPEASVEEHRSYLANKYGL